MPIFEEWKVIKDYPSYEVSNMGEVRNKAKRKGMITTWTTKNTQMALSTPAIV